MPQRLKADDSAQAANLPEVWTTIGVQMSDGEALARMRPKVVADNGNYRGGEPVTLPHFSEMPTFGAK